jgi:hypothetical protein
VAKALFHKGQKVFVRPVGTHAVIERVLPQWVKGVEEPLKVNYDVGLGREFASHELVADQDDKRQNTEVGDENWRVLRIKSRFDIEGQEDVGPYPGTFPVIVTDQRDWGGWRVPKAEYDRDPERIEFQAVVMANGLSLLKVARAVVSMAEDLGPEAPAGFGVMAAEANEALKRIYGQPKSDEPSVDDDISPLLRRLAART